MKELERSQFTLVGAAAVLILGLCSSPALASSGVKPDRDEVRDEVPDPALPAPSLNIAVVDLGKTDAAGVQELPAGIAPEKIAAPALPDDIELLDDSESSDAEAMPVSTPPETALRLPGVAAEDLPHFRRQMYRTDI